MGLVKRIETQVACGNGHTHGGNYVLIAGGRLLPAADLHELGGRLAYAFDEGFKGVEAKACVANSAQYRDLTSLEQQTILATARRIIDDRTE